MQSGTIPIKDIPGGFDLQSTLESGQTYLWHRSDDQTYESPFSYGSPAWYHTVYDGHILFVRQTNSRLEWRATTNATPILKRLLRLTDDLSLIFDVTPPDQLVSTAFETYRGMRLVRDPFFPCLISFICSPQMRVNRIFQMQCALSRTYGDSYSLGGDRYHAFPTPDQLAATTEQELRDLGLGYRAPYVQRTAEIVATEELTRTDIPLEYEAARDALTGYVGVGDKVADCVLLFSLGYLQAVPLDTWIRTAIAEYYPTCDRGNYRETSRAIRAQFGPFAGYAQTYVFHYLREGGVPSEKLPNTH